MLPRSRLSTVVGLAAALGFTAFGCAGPVTVKPRVPPAPPHDTRQLRLSLYLDPAIAAARIVSKAPTGDVGLGDVTVTFEIGAPLSETVTGAARADLL